MKCQVYITSRTNFRPTKQNLHRIDENKIVTLITLQSLQTLHIIVGVGYAGRSMVHVHVCPCVTIVTYCGEDILAQSVVQVLS